MSFGVAGETARAMFKVLQEAEHHMKTGHCQGLKESRAYNILLQASCFLDKQKLDYGLNSGAPEMADLF